MTTATHPIALSIVIPMYNEEDNAVSLVQEIQQALNPALTFEIIVVDDGSKDHTAQRLKSAQASIPTLRILHHRRNYGQSAGVISGVRAARYEWVATLDGDGQNNPADIPKLLAALGPAPDPKTLAAGNRRKRNDDWLKRCSSRIANNIRSRLLKDACPDTGCGLKLFHRETFLQLPHFNHLHRFLPALYARMGGTVQIVAVDHRPRRAGQSKYGVMNRLWVGIMDLFGVMWLQKRPCNPEVKHE